jgi:Acyclic terpene utilisation family protein AtuA
MTRSSVRIGCGAGFWGDTPEGPAQLVRQGDIDYLVLDYLAEITMSILARMKMRKPELGYATDFVDNVMRPLAHDIAQKRIRVITNAGGVNPAACRDVLLSLFKEIGVELKVALVTGDDLTGRAAAMRAAGTKEMSSGAPMPESLISVNAYLGAAPIAAALALGADVVVTGRCVDSALTLGPLMHEFGWSAQDYDRLAAGSLAGHILECGAQATGGIFTDWREIEGWDDMGFPIAEVCADGSFEIAKPQGTGGLISTATVAEQIIYEVGDPARYILPDVVCDFSSVRLQQAGPNRVRVSGARGLPPTPSYKVSATYADGFRAGVTMMIGGRDAVEKAERVGAAILARCRRLMAAAGYADFRDASIETLGAETTYGPHARAGQTREVVLKIAVRHDDRKALEIFGREIYPAATAMAQGLTGFAGGRPEPQAVVRLFSCLVPKSEAPAEIRLGDKTVSVVGNLQGEELASRATPPAPAEDAIDGATALVPLIALAHGRSGDKGDSANIGILARKQDYVSAIRAALTPRAVAEYLAHIVKGRVERFEWPGLDGFNFLLHEALGGGGVASLRHDPQGKAFAQMLLDFPTPVPAAWVAAGGPLADWKALAR